MPLRHTIPLTKLFALAFGLTALTQSANAADESQKVREAARAGTRAALSAIQSYGSMRLLGISPMFSTGKSDQPSIDTAPKGQAAQFDPEAITYSATPTYATIDNRIEPLLTKGGVGLLILGLEHFDEIDTVTGVTLTIDSTQVTLTERLPPAADTQASVRGTGYTIAPYIAKQLESGVLLDASLGFGSNGLKISKNSLKGSPTSSRMFFAVGATRFDQLSKKATLSTKGAFSYSTDKVPGFYLSDNSYSTASDSTLAQFKFTANYSYKLKSATPFVELSTVFNNFTATGGSGSAPREYSSNIIGAFGMKFSSDNVYGTLKYQFERGKRQLQGYVGYRF